MFFPEDENRIFFCVDIWENPFLPTKRYIILILKKRSALESLEKAQSTTKFGSLFCVTEKLPLFIKNPMSITMVKISFEQYDKTGFIKEENFYFNNFSQKLNKYSPNF